MSGLQTPTGLELIEAWGRTYAIVGAAGSSSLSVVEVTATGALVPRDHVFDDMESRFLGVTALTSVLAGDRAFVLAGGADDGITLFELLPGGRLLLRDTVADGHGLTLDDPAALAAVAGSHALQVFAGSESEPGITQFSASLGVPGTTLVAGTRSVQPQGDPGENRRQQRTQTQRQGHVEQTLRQGHGAPLSSPSGRPRQICPPFRHEPCRRPRLWWQGDMKIQ